MLADKIKSSVAKLRMLAAQLPEEQRDIARRVADVLAGCEEIAAGLEAQPLPITQPVEAARLQ
jgi:hypothetical protein